MQENQITEETIVDALQKKEITPAQLIQHVRNILAGGHGHWQAKIPVNTSEKKLAFSILVDKLSGALEQARFIES